MAGKILFFLLHTLLLSGGFVAAALCKGYVFLENGGVFAVVIETVLVALFIIELISYFKISDSTIHTVLISAALCVYFMFGDDMTHFLGGGRAYTITSDCICFLGFVFSVTFVLYFLIFYYSKRAGAKKLMYIIPSAATIAAYIPLSVFGLGHIAFSVYLAVLFCTLVALYYDAITAKTADIGFYTVCSVAYAITGAELVRQYAEPAGLNSLGYGIIYMLFNIAVFAAVYIWFIINTSREAVKASEYERELTALKSEALREQIKPHFVFNSLTTIKSLYHTDTAAGDSAMALFSKHLRDNVEAVESGLVPFEKELSNVQNYIELENLKYEKKYNVLFDIDCTDFYVPFLSLQPFAENAIKYSHVNEKEDGYIEISSEETDSEIIICIKDNGVGFDVNGVSDKSCGIRNVKERFSLLLDASVTVKSEVGVGTEVEIRIDKQKLANPDRPVWSVTSERENNLFKSRRKRK